MSSRLERDYQKRLIKKLRSEFPESIILKNDSSYLQGVPDLIVLNGDTWATLEVKRSSDETPQPNQAYYVDEMNQMSFSKFIHPENEEQVINDLHLYFSID